MAQERAFQAVFALVISAALLYHVICSALYWKMVGFWVFGMTMFAFYQFQYWWYPEFEGFDINVREPKVKFHKMSYKIDRENFNGNPFCQMFWAQFSAILTPIELCVHLAMGLPEGEDTACMGMMNQELNHGKAQLYYSRSMEEELQYPPFYRKLWKFMFFRAFPAKLTTAFLVTLESSFIYVNTILSLYPSLYDRMFGGPKWVFAWHLFEESEHCWESVKDLLERLHVGWRVAIWTISLVVMPLLMIMSLIEGVYYGRHHLAKVGPIQALKYLAEWFLFIFSLINAVFVFSMIHGNIGMRPSDKAYHFAKEGAMKLYSPFVKDMKITHIQEPHGDLNARRSSSGPSVDLSTLKGLRPATDDAAPEDGNAVRQRRMSTMSTASTHSRISNLSKSSKVSSFSSLSKGREITDEQRSLYIETFQELHDAGFTTEEVRQSCFGSLDEEVLESDWQSSGSPKKNQ